MPGFVIHAFVPTLVMLAMRRYFAVRHVLLLWPLTLAPDLDYFVGIHRATLLNLFVSFFPAAFLLAWSAWGPPSADRYRGPATVALVYLGSHLLMDTFTGGIVPFYPLSDWTLCWELAVWYHYPSGSVDPTWRACSHEGPPGVSEWYPFLEWDQSAMLVFLVAAWLGYAVARAVEGRRALRASG